MKWLPRWKTLPWDVHLGAFAVLLAAFSFFACVVAGPPDLLGMAFWLLTRLLVGVSVIATTILLIVKSPRMWRALFLCVMIACLAAGVAVSLDATVDLHLIFCVFMAGGPQSVNDWAQGLLREQEGKSENRMVEPEELPPHILRGLPGWVSVGGTLWSDQPRVRVELGGGFYHYGIVVYPKELELPTEWWQQIIGWPPEIVVYHED